MSDMGRAVALAAAIAAACLMFVGFPLVGLILALLGHEAGWVVVAAYATFAIIVRLIIGHWPWPWEHMYPEDGS